MRTLHRLSLLLQASAGRAKAATYSSPSWQTVYLSKQTNKQKTGAGMLCCYARAVSRRLRVDGGSEGWWGPRASTALSKTFPAKAGVVLAAAAGAKLSASTNTRPRLDLEQLGSRAARPASDAHPQTAHRAPPPPPAPDMPRKPLGPHCARCACTDARRQPP